MPRASDENKRISGALMPLSLFSKKQPVEQPIEERGGKYVLRKSIASRLTKKQSLQTLVQLINTPQDKLIAFAEGADNLDEAQLSAVANYVFGNATYSAELDRLVSTAKPPTSMGVSPAPFQPSAAVGMQYPAPFMPRTAIAPAPPAPDMVEPSKFNRPEGWL
jgi:hypothetical protein